MSVTTCCDVCICCANRIKNNSHVEDTAKQRLDRLVSEGRCVYVTDFRGQGVFYYDDELSSKKFGQEEPGYVPPFCPYITELTVCQTEA